MDVSPILSPDHDHYRESLYELRAVLVHDGSVSRGHYTNLHIGLDTNWGTDNGQVNENVRSQSAAAYVLMYTRLGEGVPYCGAPGGLTNSGVICFLTQCANLCGAAPPQSPTKFLKDP